MMKNLLPVFTILLYASTFSALSAPGDRDPGFTPPADLNEEVGAIALRADGKIIIGGNFTNVDGISTLDSIIRLDPDGSRDPDFVPIEGLSTDLETLALQPDGKIVIGGYFVDVDGISTLDSIARLEEDGSRDMGFTPPANLNGEVYSILVQPDGKILVGGAFDEVDGITTLDRIVRLDENGSRDTGFTPPEDISDYVFSIALQPGGKILVGGQFLNVDGISTLDRIVRLNTNGSRDTGFTPPADLNGAVLAIAVQADGKILIGGGFFSVDGISNLDRIIRLNANGTRDTGFTPPENLNGGVECITLLPGGQILVGGGFSEVDGISTLDRLIRLNANGSLDMGFIPPEDLGGGVRSIVTQSDGKALIGGNFTEVDGISTLDRIFRIEAFTPLTPNPAVILDGALKKKIKKLKKAIKKAKKKRQFAKAKRLTKKLKKLKGKLLDLQKSKLD